MSAREILFDMPPPIISNEAGNVVKQSCPQRGGLRDLSSFWSSAVFLQSGKQLLLACGGRVSCATGIVGAALRRSSCCSERPASGKSPAAAAIRRGAGERLNELVFWHLARVPPPELKYCGCFWRCWRQTPHGATLCELRRRGAQITSGPILFRKCLLLQVLDTRLRGDVDGPFSRCLMQKETQKSERVAEDGGGSLMR